MKRATRTSPRRQRPAKWSAAAATVALITILTMAACNGDSPQMPAAAPQQGTGTSAAQARPTATTTRATAESPQTKPPESKPEPTRGDEQPTTTTAPETGAHTYANDIFIASLSEPEQDCVRMTWASDEELLRTLAQTGPSPGNPVMTCLEDENRKRIYMMLPERGPRQSEPMKECVWEGVRAIVDSPRPEPENRDETTGKILGVMTSVPVYCAGLHQPEIIGKIFGPDAELQPDAADIDQLTCVINKAGGPNGWATLLMGDVDEAAKGLELYEAECRH